jgi:hypothetical protein
MELLTKELIQELWQQTRQPCLSLYMSTDRKHPENLKNPIKFKNLVSQMEESLLQKYSAGEAREYLEPLEALVNDNDIWNYTKMDLPFLVQKELFKVVSIA